MLQYLFYKKKLQLNKALDGKRNSYGFKVQALFSS